MEVVVVVGGDWTPQYSHRALHPPPPPTPTTRTQHTHMLVLVYKSKAPSPVFHCHQLLYSARVHVSIIKSTWFLVLRFYYLLLWHFKTTIDHGPHY